VTFTNKVYEAAKFVGIRLLDHIIVGDDCFSFLDAGLMPGTAP
jgi:DNA repair protein RadC